MIARHLAFFAPAAVMSAWGAILLHTITSGHLNRLLSPIFRPGVLATAILLFTLSVLYLLLYQPSTQPTPTEARTSSFRQLGRWLVLLIPIIAASILSPNALSSTTLANRSSYDLSASAAAPMPSMNQASAENVKAALAADPNQPVPLEVTDLITLSRTPAQIPAFEGRKIRTVGVILAKPGSDPKLVRWVMWCCAADAQPVSVELTGNTKGDWKENQWLEIIGTARFPSTLGRITPKIDVDSIKPVGEPDEPYLSP